MLFFKNFYSEIYEDSYTEGEGKFTGCGYPMTRIGEEFETLPDLIKYFSNNYGYSANPDDYETDDDRNVIYTSKMVADHSNAQNGGWMEPAEKEKADWKKGKGKLYVENVYLSVITG